MNKLKYHYIISLQFRIRELSPSCLENPSRKQTNWIRQVLTITVVEMLHAVRAWVLVAGNIPLAQAYQYVLSQCNEGKVLCNFCHTFVVTSDMSHIWDKWSCVYKLVWFTSQPLPPPVSATLRGESVGVPGTDVLQSIHMRLFSATLCPHKCLGWVWM